MFATGCRFAERNESVARKATDDGDEPAVRRIEGGYEDWVVVAIHGLRELLNHLNRTLLDELAEMPDILAKLGLKVAELPDFKTLCFRYQDLQIAVLRALLRHSSHLVQAGEIQAIGATEFDRHGASHHYANRVNYIYWAVKTTALIDTQSHLILEIHCSIKHPHDTQIARQVLDRVGTLTAKIGCDSDSFRDYLRTTSGRPVNNH